MKTYNILIIVIGALLFATNCKNEEDKVQPRYSVLGVISIAGDSTIITSDHGDRFLVTNSVANSNIKDKDRVFAEFNLAEKTLPSGINYIIVLTYIEKILYKPVIELTPAVADSIGNNELGITENDIWVVKNFLNLNFYFYSGGGNIKHYINLVRNPGAIRTDTVDLEIRHNNNLDGLTNKYYGFVSFDLTSLKNNIADSVILRVKAKEFNNRIFEKFFTYKY